MNVGTLVAGEADITNLPGFLCLQHGLQRSACGKNAVRIGVANHLMKLKEIDSVGLKAAQGLVDLICSSSLGPSVDLGHEKGFLAIAVPQRVAHADFTLAAVVVPAVVEKIDSLIEARAYDANALLRIGLFAKVIATESNERNFLSGAAQRSIRNAIPGFRWRGLLASFRQENGCRREAQKFTPGNSCAR